MKAIPAIYEDGQVQFLFNNPAYEGPVSILVVFPDDWQPFERDVACDVDEAESHGYIIFTRDGSG